MTILGFSLSSPVGRGSSRWAWFDIFTPTLDADARLIGKAALQWAERLGMPLDRVRVDRAEQVVNNYSGERCGTRASVRVYE